MFNNNSMDYFYLCYAVCFFYLVVHNNIFNNNLSYLTYVDF